MSGLEEVGALVVQGRENGPLARVLTERLGDAVQERSILTIAAELDGEWVERHYSIASRSGDQLELFLTLVPEGRLTPHLYKMNAGDQLWCWSKPKGKFVLDKVPDGSDLWLVGTGTGLAPFLSMIRHGGCFERFEHVVLVHSVRHAADLCYQPELRALMARHPGLRYVPATSRESVEHALAGRVTTALVMESSNSGPSLLPVSTAR